MDIRDIRDWLDRNKIFFETITAVLLSIMAIIVSFQANQIASYQTELMKAEHRPILHFSVDLVFDPESGKYTHDRLVITNIGSPLSEFECRDAVFFKVTYGNESEVPKTALIPILGYYDTTILGNNPTGILATFANLGLPEGNNRKAVQTIWGFAKFAQERNAIGLADIVRYVEVSYKDIWGETHNEVYLVDTFGARKLSESEGKKIFEDYENKLRQGLFIEFSSLSPEDLYEKWLIVHKS